MRWLGVFALLCGLAACGGRGGPDRITGIPAQFGDSAPHPWVGRSPDRYAVHGIDVSRWQGDIDWHRVRQANVAFAFIKATEGGDHADPMFRAHWDGAAAAGIPRGAYHYYYFCRTAYEQAAWFIQHVPRGPRTLPPVLDLEWTPTSRTCTLRPSPAQVRSEAAIFLTILSQYYGQRPIIYSTVDFYHQNELWRIDHGQEFWLRSVAGHPSTVYPGRDWTFWQYTGTGRVPGIQGNADINAFNGSSGDWAGWLRARMQ